MKIYITFLIVGAISFAAYGSSQASPGTHQEQYAARFSRGNTWVMKASRRGSAATETFVFKFTTLPRPIKNSASLYGEAVVGSSKGTIFVQHEGGFHMVAFRNPKIVVTPSADEGDENAVYCFVDDRDHRRTTYAGLSFFGTGTDYYLKGVVLNKSDPNLGSCTVSKQ
jgi:hypothetical protein